jgi:hypothetical protein
LSDPRLVLRAVVVPRLVDHCLQSARIAAPSRARPPYRLRIIRRGTT